MTRIDYPDFTQEYDSSGEAFDPCAECSFYRTCPAGYDSDSLYCKYDTQPDDYSNDDDNGGY